MRTNAAIPAAVNDDLAERLAGEPRASVQQLGGLTIIVLKGGNARIEIRATTIAIRLTVAGRMIILDHYDPTIWDSLDRMITQNGYHIEPNRS